MPCLLCSFSLQQTDKNLALLLCYTYIKLENKNDLKTKMHSYQLVYHTEKLYMVLVSKATDDKPLKSLQGIWLGPEN